MMNSKKILITKFIAYGCLLVTVCTMQGCVEKSVGIPVKEYQRQLASDVNRASINAKMLEEISAMSLVTENSVFTERFGESEYVIGPGDVLELTAWERTKPEKYETRVRSDGRISYSFLDDIVVSGLTPTQVDRELTEKLSKYIKNVRIDVSVTKYESKSVLLFGEINILQTGKSGPGKYTLKGKTRLLDIIVAAGGMTKDSDLKKVELVRQGKRYTLNLYNAMFRGDMSRNVIMDDGDMVTVPELPELGERVYVFGEVKNKGIYPHEDTSDLLAAIGRAGGCTKVAVKSDVKIIRGYGKGEPIVLSANLDAILKQGDIAQNITLQDGDVVYVPRTLIGDLNEFIANATPLLEYLLYPARYDRAYSDSLTVRTY